MNKVCNICGEKYHARGMCKTCYHKWYYLQHLNPIPYHKNKSCSKYLGVHIAEHVLSKVFKNVEIMPMDNPGYDFICNKGMKIDVKSSCLSTHHGHKSQWLFRIKQNVTADYFLCIAFDNRKSLTPLHLWLIPGKHINYLQSASISINALDKWNSFALDINRVAVCCNSIK